MIVVGTFQFYIKWGEMFGEALQVVKNKCKVNFKMGEGS